MREPRLDWWHARVNGWAMSPVWRPRARAALLRRLGFEIGEGTEVQPSSFGSTLITIGSWSYVGPGCQLDATEPITIGDSVALGNDVLLITSSHDHSDSRHRAGTARNAPVVIEDGAWLGARVVVLPGVTVGAGCVVAAGSVVTADCAPHGLYAGAPATRRRDLPVEDA